MPTDRSAARARRQQTRDADAIRVEKAAELLAPAAQRHAVMANGEVIRHARAVPDGISFKRSSPVRHMAKHGGLDSDHVRAADRLSTAWETGGGSIGMGASQYGERTSGTPNMSGMLAEGVLNAVRAQNLARDEVVAAARALGGGFNVVRSVVLEGLDVAAWGRLHGGKNCQVAKGYLLAALDELVSFYRRLDAARATTSRMRAAVVVQRRNGVVAL